MLSQGEQGYIQQLLLVLLFLVAMCTTIPRMDTMHGRRAASSHGQS